MISTIEGEDEEFVLLLLQKGVPIDKVDKVLTTLYCLYSFPLTDDILLSIGWEDSLSTCYSTRVDFLNGVVASSRSESQSSGQGKFILLFSYPFHS